jgi:hypothetical protein
MLRFQCGFDDIDIHGLHDRKKKGLGFGRQLYQMRP